MQARIEGEHLERPRVWTARGLIPAPKGYYDQFPPTEMNVSVTTATIDIGDNQAMKKNILMVTKDIKAGDVIYKVESSAAASSLPFEFLCRKTQWSQLLTRTLNLQVPIVLIVFERLTLLCLFVLWMTH
jgi:hypothetical protein